MMFENQYNLNCSIRVNLINYNAKYSKLLPKLKSVLIHSLFCDNVTVVIGREDKVGWIACAKLKLNLICN